MYNVSSVSLQRFSYITSLLYFSYIILFFLHFSFQTTCSRLAKSNLQLSIQKCKINLCNMASVQYNYSWMITKQQLVKTHRKYHFFKKLFKFHLRRFASLGLCLPLFRFLNKICMYCQQLSITLFSLVEHFVIV